MDTQETVAAQAHVLKRSERFAKTGTWRMELDTGRVTWSEGMYRVFGFDIDAFSGDMAEVAVQALSREDRTRMQQITSCLVKDGFPSSLELRTTLPDGQIRWIRAEGNLEGHGSQRSSVLVGFVLDVTELKASAVELGRRDAQLQALLAEREGNLEQLSRSFSSLIDVVCMVVEKRDPYTAGHERRVSHLAVCMARMLGISADELEEIRVAALIHDVGKVSVPAEILSKPDALSPEEFGLVMCHVETGHQILAKANMAESIGELVYDHHERCDATGYPRQLSSEAIPQGGKILMVADVVEAMMSHRPYRPALGVGAALSEIRRGSGSAYDSDVCAACEQVFANGFAFQSP